MKKLILILLILTTLTSCQTKCQELLSQRRRMIDEYNFRIAIRNPVDSTFVYNELKQTDSLIFKYCDCNETK